MNTPETSKFDGGSNRATAVFRGWAVLEIKRREDSRPTRSDSVKLYGLTPSDRRPGEPVYPRRLLRRVQEKILEHLNVLWLK